MEGTAELESFRRQWREEVSRRTNASSPGLSGPLTEQDGLLPTNHGIVDSQQDYSEFVQRVEHLSIQTGDEGTSCDVPQNLHRDAEKVVGNSDESVCHLPHFM